ncbi:putative N(2),N(2)-dimethylguanosine tRNA methyltransferase 2 [Hibiscus syriacus]|uniref:N(2),N(2)-dimethylguanosine tRNA methyltransferase 2 n=1 Tax=Hibiscus syriacus TaxID=106335 RepID=A0A6A2Z2C8_HIBSY|nr:scarecrow-like protein 3 [Hibiscus syriacus]KAE8686091.1 putative N(2),N(2)-dimethylguanosine tRNA methyltransferase 2 [Hibiscus syriacus]
MAETSSNPKPDQMTLSLTLSQGLTPREAKPEERGIRLIQLLLKCAKHASSGNLHRADECLRQITLLASVSGDSMQRLSAWFASALAVRLVKRWPGLHKSLNYSQLQKQEQFDQARLHVGRAFPYLALSYAIISRTLVKAMTSERVIHLVDLGSGDLNLWIPLIRSFSCLHTEPPLLKITCMNANRVRLENLGTRLVKEAETLNIPFQFSSLNVSLRELTLDKLKVTSGEALAFISILNLHTLLAEDDSVDAHFSHNNKTNGIKDSKQMSQFLSTIRSSSPKLLFLVEKEADHNLNKLIDRFVEGLHYYSAVFDSVDATLRANASSGERLVLEEMFGKEIENIVACEGVERVERHERYGRWMVRFGQAGFKPVRMWHDSMEDAKEMMEACGRNGYNIVNEKASLMICWHDRPLYAVSAWTC